MKTDINKNRFKPYSAMKPSGVPWMGEVPEHWQLQRMKTLLHERVQKGFPDEPLLAATQSKGVVLSVHVPIAPLDEAEAIAWEISDATARGERAISRLVCEIELLREYRTRLIADVVTGKVDVREAASQLPEEIGDQEQLEEFEALNDNDEESADEIDDDAGEATNE